MNSASPAPCRILVIDDTPTIHDDFRKILAPAESPAPDLDTLAAAIFGAASARPAPARFALDSAAQGQTGVALVEDAVAAGRPYAVAFVDMRMPPGWDGLETIRRLWAVDPHLQVVICTAYSDHSWSTISEKLGQSDNLLILKKPFDNIEVLQLAHALARKWRLAREVEAHVAGLGDQLHARTAELRQAQKMETVGQLAAGVTHDFNNLLTVIQGYTDELLARPGGDSAARAMLEPVRAAAQRAARLTRQLLLFSRKDAARPQPLDLAAVLGELRPLLRRLIGSDIELRWDLPPALAAVTADPADLEQVIVNLVVNARDAMPGGGRIAIAARERALAAGDPALEAGAQPGRYIELEVADTGAGISPAVLPRIFEPFFTTKEAGKGTGLGLSTVYSIVRRQGGWIRVRSAPGAGAAFTIFQPVAEGLAAGAAPAPAAAAPAREGWRNVLVVEDDPNVQSLLSGILARRGIPHTLAADGVAAQEIWRSAPAPFDLLITDIVMPNGVNGLRLARNLREQDPRLGVILSSGIGELLADPARHAMRGVAPSLLPKPYGPDDLLAAMHAARAARAA